jgi:predicted dehydrogenase
MEASASRVADAAAGSQVQVGTGASGVDRLEPYRNELESFCSAIKYRTEPACTGAAALAAAIVILKGNEAIERGQPIKLEPGLYAV